MKSRMFPTSNCNMCAFLVPLDKLKPSMRADAEVIEQLTGKRIIGWCSRLHRFVYHRVGKCSFFMQKHSRQAARLVIK